ncbi:MULTISPECIES: glycosyltransferase [unclassified Cryobacterium]|uniref:glycosyltransferase n=1 Tax=unclassified Cryobacterium TaxID=2649013 RepID=UPI001069BFCE|nr:MULTISPECIES: glycosyltransferase [unclassified Cryobacterium]TFC56440.1 glycosyltransferase [Cryobacterium sp. TMB3-1-2]TFC67355.1 glycosyltransferase [Cryobacterium sp. TMB3-15]TFC73132.1 glycosyltransferase [Cryobacterium sp. TMB3-10]TFD37864.1 glycosyltransferase [Cryobacterium sp. TMB3-12]
MSDLLSTAFGRPALFTADLSAPAAEKLGSALTERQLALLVSATNFHALDNPGARLRIVVHINRPGLGAHLTDAGTRHEKVTAEATRVAEFTIVSTVAGSPHPHYTHTRKSWLTDPETGVRNIVIDAEREPGSTATVGRASLYWRLRGGIERRYPFEYDRLRQWLLRGRESSLNSTVVARRVVDLTGVPTGGTATDLEPAVIIGLHWLELGGAERWAMESIALARNSGLRPIVITDVPSTHPWITKAELDGAIVLTLTHPVNQPEHSEPVLEALATNFDIRGAFVHHSRWLYDRLPWLRNRIPGLHVATTHHILEYNGGGYPAIGAALDEFIDVHHVISPQLQDWFVRVQGVDPAKVALAPLIGLTTTGSVAEVARARVDESVLTLGFIGRFAAQKRPYLFTKLVRELQDVEGLTIRVVIQGGGELEQFVRRDIDSHKLSSLVEWVDEGSPVSNTLARIDCLVLSSQNEGLTLTTLEALAAGVPVISTDVGSQRTVIVPDALVSRDPGLFLTEASEIVTRMAGSEDYRTDVWRREVALAQEFTEYESAHDWAGKLFELWIK